MQFLCLEFINSQWYITHKPHADPLLDAQWLAELCQTWNLPRITPSMPGFDALPALRAALLPMLLQAVGGETPTGEELAYINQILASETPRKRLVHGEGRYRLQTLRPTDPITYVTYRIVLSFCELLAEHPLAYLRKCANPDCNWVFYDSSKSHTRKWCDSKCASLMKVRKYRAAHKENANP